MTDYKLKDLLEIKNGRDYKHLSNGIIPVYGSGGLMTYVDEFLYDNESILLPRKGTLTNIQYVNKAFWTVDTIYYSIIDKTKAEPYFLYYYLTQLDLKHLNSGTGVPSMTFGAYYDISIKLPNLQTQKKIAKVLSDLDAKIEVNNKINQELEAMAKTLYDYWFVQFDFPDASGKPYKSSGGKMEYNEALKREIPEGWQVTSFGSVSEISRGKLITEKTANLNGNVKVVSAGVDYSYYHDESNREKYTITVSGSGANAGYINFWREPIFANDCSTIRGRNDYETFVFLQFLRLRQEYIFNQARGSAQPHVYPKDLSSLKILIPNSDLFKKYGEKVLALNEKISINTIENQKLTELRDWLLPMLMNGQVRVGEEIEKSIL